MDGGVGGCGGGMSAEPVDGRRPFVTELKRFAETVPTANVSPLIRQILDPIRVAVSGRPGVGRSTVEQALRGRGVQVVAGASAELRVLVIAEALKPEDQAALASSELPTVIVLTKADVSAPATAATVVPMIGLLATVTNLDDELVAALRSFVDEPPDLSSVDAFIQAVHPVDRDMRTRLLDRLDRFGIANAVRALAAGAEPTAVVELLQQLSNVDDVLARLHAVAAPVRYRRVQWALGELRAVAARTDDERLWQLLGADATTTALMAAAVDVLEAAGWAVAGAEEADMPARRAVQWNRYARGPVNALHRACAADVVRGSLRLLDQA
jgi:hypothetical protein